MNIQGKLLEIFETENKNGFRRREFIVEYAENPDYPQTVKFQMTQDNCSKLDKFAVGDSVELEFNLRGRKWISPEGKVVYFNSLEVWKMQKTDGSGNSQAPASDPGFEPLPDDDMPF